MEKKLNYSPIEIANYFLNKEKYEITNLKLNKLVYLTFGWGTTLSAILFNEPIEAWYKGPVVRSVHNKFKFEDKEYNDIIPKKIFIGTVKKKNFTEMDINLFDWIYNEYAPLLDNELSQITHEDPNHQTPWKQYYKKGQKNIIIPTESIVEYYQELHYKYIEKKRKELDKYLESNPENEKKFLNEMEEDEDYKQLVKEMSVS